jgi:phage baseplate assembly protein gpV
MQHDGSRETVVEKDEYIRVKGDLKIVGDLDATIEISGNCKVVIGGDATIEVAGSTLLDCPSTTVTGDLRVDGEVSVGGDVNTDAGISLNKHKHKILSGSSKGTSDKPV